VCKSIPNLPDLDPTARIRVVAGRPIVVIATLADGRTAKRDVPDVASLRHTIEALIVVPPVPSVDHAGGPPAAAPPSSASKPTDPGAPAAPPPEPLLSVELGAVFMGRAQGTPVYAGLGPVAWGALNYADWLFGVGLRFDPYVAQPTTTLTSFTMMTFGGGLELARRFRVHRLVGLDVGLGLQVLQEHQSARTDGGQEEEELEESSVSGDSTDVRLLAISRLHVGGRGFRFTTDLELELSPLRVGRDDRIDPSLPTLPSFGVGLGAGISWQGP